MYCSVGDAQSDVCPPKKVEKNRPIKPIEQSSAFGEAAVITLTDGALRMIGAPVVKERGGCLLSMGRAALDSLLVGIVCELVALLSGPMVVVVGAVLGLGCQSSSSIVELSLLALACNGNWTFALSGLRHVSAFSR